MAWGKRKGERRSRTPFGLSEEQLVRMRPSFDARIAKAAPGSRKLAGAHALRALACHAAGDPAGALADADAALAVDGLRPAVERQAVMAFTRAVIALECADRYEEALERVTVARTGRADAATAQNLRIEHAQILMLLGRQQEAAAVLRSSPLHVYPDRPDYAMALLARAGLLVDGGDPASALEDIDNAMDAGIDADLVPQAANLGAYCIAVLGREDRIEQALAWANLACTPAIGNEAASSLAHRETRAAVLTVAGRGAEAIATLEEGLTFLEEHQPQENARAWSHAFLARAHLDAGELDAARRHAGLADELAEAGRTSVPVLDAVRHRLT